MRGSCCFSRHRPSSGQKCGHPFEMGFNFSNLTFFISLFYTTAVSNRRYDIMLEKPLVFNQFFPVTLKYGQNEMETAG